MADWENLYGPPRLLGRRGGPVPHVVLVGDVDMEEVFRRLRPVFVKSERGILKATDSYIDRGRRNILIDALSIEAGEQTRFLVMISQREDGLVVRLWPGLEVDKTDGVKRVLAETAKQLLENFAGLVVGETNLQRFM
jgi:hypothetical protein